MEKWNPGFASDSPLFAPLRAHAARLCGTDWPDLPRLQEVLDARGIVTAGGKPLRVAEPLATIAALEDRYEARIYLRGELEVRPRDWHDLFNVLAWVVFPQAKAALNARHYQALLDQQARGELNRGAAQDALTLFDEGGIVVVSSDASLLDDLRQFRWKPLFWQRRAMVMQRMRWFVFGHALYEKALAPFEGITARGVLFEVEDDWLELPFTEQLNTLDARLAQRIADRDLFKRTRELAPVPLLGIPGWRAQNECESYYDNAAYFRSGRRSGNQPG